ncbi:unnamed protein product [Pedinophyceae sp. YPF-701]|nr:unnamed protein product [Pedinophyceae sp. YPF-701]
MELQCPPDALRSAAPGPFGSARDAHGASTCSSSRAGLRGCAAASSAEGDPPARNGVVWELAVSGSAVGIATTCTTPIDVVKTHMQLRPAYQPGSGQPRPPGILGTAAALVRSDGPAALTYGLTPALLRAVTYGGVRLGLYKPLKELMVPAAGPGPTDHDPSKTSTGDVPVAGKLAAATLSGALAGGASSPMDLVKVRMQAGGAREGVAGVLRTLVQADGVGGLWKGSGPSMARAAILTASQLVTYEEVKRGVRSATGWQEGFGVQVAASMATGLVTTTATAPVDVVKTRMFVGGRRGAGPLESALGILRAEGPRGLLRGWAASYVRLGPQTAITFLAAEQLRRLAGMEHI